MAEDVTVSLRIDIGRLGQRLREMAIGLRNPLRGRAGQQVIAAMRRSVAREFELGGWFAPRGGFRRWAPNATGPAGGAAFGSRRAPSVPLGGASGRIARAWAGGPGGFVRQTENRILLGVRAPWAAVHRGGTGAEISDSRSTTIRGTMSMWWYLGLHYGVWMNRERLLAHGIKIPARPHATSNPELRAEIRKILVRSWSHRSRGNG